MSMNPIRVTGLASGMDTQSLVDKLMKAERIPLDQLNQQKQTLEWQQEDYRSMNALLLDLNNAGSDLRLQGTFLAQTATSSNSSAVTATADGTAVESINSISVSQLAQGAFLTSGQLGGTNNTGEAITSGSNKVNTTGSTITLNLNGQSINVTNNMTVDQFVSAVNNQSSNTNVKVSYDGTQNRFFFTSTNTGASAKIDFTGTTGATAQDFIANTLQLGTGAYTTPVTGKDATVKLNGTTMNYSTNNFTVSGVTYSLKGVTTQTESVTVSRDSDTIFNKIKGFVDKYNEVIDKINSKISEKRYRNYPPLTDSQKSSMKDSDIQLWTDKAKSGLLHNDMLLTNVLYKMRNDFSSPVTGLASGAYNQLADIGITTGSWKEQGKLHIDEAKLKNAIQSNPQQVMDLFSKTSSTSTATNNSGEGIAKRMYDDINNAMDQITNKAGSSNSSFDYYDNSIIGKELKDYDSRITDLQATLATKETNYYNQFTAMEKYMNQMQSQSAWLSSQLGG